MVDIDVLIFVSINVLTFHYGNEANNAISLIPYVERHVSERKGEGETLGRRGSHKVKGNESKFRCLHQKLV